MQTIQELEERLELGGWNPPKCLEDSLKDSQKPVGEGCTCEELNEN